MKKATAFLAVLCLVFFSSCASSLSSEKSEAAGAVTAPKTIFIRSQVDSVSPPDSAVNVSTIAKIKIIFRKNTPDVKTSSKFLYLVVSGNGKVACDIKCRQGEFCLVPQKRLDPATKYFVTIANLSYADETLLAGSLTWSFMTGM
jgi:hypothetical protein